MKGILRFILFMAVMGLIGWAGTTMLGTVKPEKLASVDGVSAVQTTQYPANPTYGLSILFIGNSYTYTQDMPGQLLRIAQSDAGNQTQFTIQSVTRGGVGLQELWQDGKALEALQSRRWDYVVLQQQSFWAMFPDSVIDTIKIARAFDAEIKAAGARTVLFTTWARKPGSHWYSGKESAFLKNPEYMQKKFTQQTEELGKKLEAVVVPVGDYWAYANAALPDIDLYSSDGTHPSAAGSYLTALVFYRYFSQRTVEGVTYHPYGVGAEQAAKLKSVIR